MAYTKRFDGRAFDEPRPIRAEVDIIDNADGSALFAFGDTVAIAAVYGPRQLFPQHLQNPERALLRAYYDMLSFSVKERKKPGPSRRSLEISHVTTQALEPVVMLDKFQNCVIDVYIQILQANASTRTAGINAASIALAHAGIPMRDLVTSVSVGKVGGSLIVDLTKEEEDYKENGKKAATDIALAMEAKSKKIALLQLDGNIAPKELLQAVELATEASKKIYEAQIKALKEINKKWI
ncbi:MAG: exosome complex exonuclease Rrp41 [Candidatus Pacearchaeota archaeon]